MSLLFVDCNIYVSSNSLADLLVNAVLCLSNYGQITCLKKQIINLISYLTFVAMP